MTDLSNVEQPRGSSGEVLATGPAGGRDFFGAALGPALLESCKGRLEELRWFRADWQRGGALTGYATWIDDTGGRCPAVVKLPVPPQELTWLERLQPSEHEADQVVPHVYAGGRALGGYDFAWVVMQRLTHGPLDHRWQGAEIELLAEALARFYHAARTYSADQPPRPEDWADVLARSRKAVKEGEMAESQRWNASLKALHRKLAKVLTAWDARDVSHWCHGDVHLGNAMTLEPPPGGPAVLFDLALVHAGHWVEDAVYFEHLFWSHMGRFRGVDVVKLIASRRKARGLCAEGNWPRLANIRRVLLASSAPLEQQAEQTNPHHLHAALLALENLLPHVL